ncbi:MAG: hypothetical protein ABRQ39_27425 [Candidatus Eremiobacterota bacterium]
MKNQRYLLLFLILLLLILPFQAVNHIHSNMEREDNCLACEWMQIFYAIFTFLLIFLEIILLFKPLCLNETFYKDLWSSSVYSTRGPPEN